MKRLMLSLLLPVSLLAPLLLKTCAGATQEPLTPAKKFVAAHRGYSQVAPENTLPAFEQAYRAGADAIEFDMQVTKDSHVVIMHDPFVNRTTNGKGKIAQLTLAQIEKLDAGSWFSPAFKGTKVPTLALLLDQFKHYPTGYMISEIKHYRTQKDIPLMIDPILKRHLEKRTIVSSFSPSDLRMVRTMSRQIGIGYLCPSRLSVLRAYQLAKNDPNTWVLAHAHILVFHPELVQQALSNHIRLAAWTVDREEQLDDLELLGVHAFVTDSPKMIERE